MSVERHLVRCSYWQGGYCHWDLQYRWPNNEKELANLDGLFRMLIDVARMSLPEQTPVANELTPEFTPPAGEGV